MTTNLDYRDRKEYCYSGEWTTTPPTVEGWYWFSPKLSGKWLESFPVKVEKHYLTGELVILEDYDYDADEYRAPSVYGDTSFSSPVEDRRWLGPLPVPEPPKD